MCPPSLSSTSAGRKYRTRPAERAKGGYNRVARHGGQGFSRASPIPLDQVGAAGGRVAARRTVARGAQRVRESVLCGGARVHRGGGSKSSGCRRSDAAF